MPDEEQIKTRLRELTRDSRRLREELKGMLRQQSPSTAPVAQDRAPAPSRRSTRKKR